MEGYRTQHEGPSFVPTGMILCNERGTALVFALSMLAILSILGSLALSSSTTEMGISGNFRNVHQAFFAADRGLSYAETNPDLYATSNVVDLFADDSGAHRAAIDVGLSGLSPGGVSTATFLGVGPPPMGAYSDASAFEAHYAMVRVSGAFPAALANASRVDIEGQVARIVPK